MLEPVILARLPCGAAYHTGVVSGRIDRRPRIAEVPWANSLEVIEQGK